jgi:hypothetical protein
MRRFYSFSVIEGFANFTYAESRYAEFYCAEFRYPNAGLQSL